MNQKEIKMQLMNLRKNLKNIALVNIYNINEKILFWKVNLNDIFIIERIIGRKIQKARITGNFCCNADEFHKFSL